MKTLNTRRVYTHHSRKPFELNLDRRYRIDRRRGNFDYWESKPPGFWFSSASSRDETWYKLLSAYPEDWWPRFAVEYRVKFHTGSNILLLENEEDMDQFHDQYGFKDHGNKYIKWKKVKAVYNGIAIFPYQENCRWPHRWYHAWDVASGCVWNLKTIKSFEYHKTNPKPEVIP